jgi:V-type H+-transporting ATPase subunit H
MPVLVGVKFFDFLENEGKQVIDEEAKSDAQFLHAELAKKIQSLNSFEEYLAELKSGSLEWSPPHKSELFWRDNGSNLLENNSEALQMLIRFMNPNMYPPSIICIAINDIGMFLEFCPKGRETFEEFGGKPRLMSLITYEDSDVRYQALTAMQKYMKKLWNPGQY